MSSHFTIPPLRQRREDIPILVQVFTERYARKLWKKITSIQKETMKALQDYPWPGNIRELVSISERAAGESKEKETTGPRTSWASTQAP